MFFAFLHDVKIIILGGRDQSQLSGKCRIQLFEMAILRPGANTEVSFFVFFFFSPSLHCSIWGLKFGLWKSERVGV